jgi:hypothetical protein
MTAQLNMSSETLPATRNQLLHVDQPQLAQLQQQQSQLEDTPSHNDAQGHGGVNKRRRIALACSTCRSRKSRVSVGI